MISFPDYIIQNRCAFGRKGTLIFNLYVSKRDAGELQTPLGILMKILLCKSGENVFRQCEENLREWQKRI